MDTQEKSSDDLSRGKEIVIQENTSKKRKMDTGKKIVKESANWTDDNKEALIDALLEQVHRGGRISTSFSKDAWDVILKQFNASQQTNYDMQAIKNCFRALRSAWLTWKVLLAKKNGWGWCHLEQKVNPPTKQHWKDFKAKHKQAVQFLKGPLKFEEKLNELFEDVMCPDEDEKSTTHEIEDIAESQPKRGVSNSTTMHTFDDDDEFVPKEPKKQKMLSTFRGRKPRKATTVPSPEAVTIIPSLGEMAKLQVSTLFATTTTSGSVSDALKILDEMEEVSVGSDMYLDAMMLLEDPTKREFFLKMNHSVRFAWLQKALDLKRQGPSPQNFSYQG